MQRYLLDTNAIIYLIGGRLAARDAKLVYRDFRSVVQALACETTPELA